ncbi:MAG: putative RNA-binding protein YlxR (DUF448 family) [Paracoccaceae bacterium]|jgi:predicted RNA-binding protein YlxR (DUF448 family)
MALSRGGRTKTDDEAERRCIATGESQPKAGLIRFVIGPEGQAVPDILERLPGRGMWVSADRAALELVVSKRLFSRSAKTPVTVPDDLVKFVEEALLRRVIDLISLARKGGNAVAGYEAVKGWMDTGKAEVLMQAIDGSTRGKTKLRRPGHSGLFIGGLSAQELGLAFGRQSVIHGALSAGGLTTRVVEDAAKLDGVRQTEGDLITEKDTKNA